MAKYIPPTKEQLRERYQEYCAWFNEEKYKGKKERQAIVDRKLGYFIQGSVIPEKLMFGEWCVNTMDMNVMRKFITQRRDERAAEFKEMSKFINGDPAQGTFSEANHERYLMVKEDNKERAMADPAYQSAKSWSDAGLKSKGYDTSGEKKSDPKPANKAKPSKIKEAFGKLVKVIQGPPKPFDIREKMIADGTFGQEKKDE